MPTTVAFEDAIDLLNADHKAVKQMFIDYHWLRETKAPPEQRQALVERICKALTVHSRIEEEINRHVLEEREKTLLQARRAALDLRALAVPLFERRQQLEEAA